MAAAVDMLEVEARLEAAGTPTGAADSSSEAGLQSAGASSNGVTVENFYSSGKSSTWKKFTKMVKHRKEGSSEGGTPVKGDGGPSHHSSLGAGGPLPIDPALALRSLSTGGHSQHGVADDGASEVAPSESGRVGSRLSMRHEGGWDSYEDGGSQKGTLKGMSMFKKQKKSKQIEFQLDAARCELGQLQERCDHAERDLASVRHDNGQLTAERDHLANQVHELTAALTLARSDLSTVEAERSRLKELHSQVKAALQDSYSSQQEQQKQIKELEELCAAQQNSLEEGEERFRALQNEQDQLHHAALAAKAQLVTAQAQLSEARTQREELMLELATLTNQVSGLQAEIDSRDEKMTGLEAAAEQANKGLESALGRLRELEREQQQLEVRVTDLQEENLELSTELSGVTEVRRQLEVSLAEAQASSAALSAQVASLQDALEASQAAGASLTARLQELSSQLASSSVEGGSLRAQNGELLAELAALREQQQQQSKPNSPLAKWHKHGSGGKSTPPAVAVLSTGHNGSNGGAPTTAAAAAGGGGPASVFSPMTSQLPAVRSLATHTAAQATTAAPGDTAGQASSSADGSPSHADSSCLVLAATGDASAAAADAATSVGPDAPSLTISTLGPLLKPPVSSSSPDMALAKGPLTASRPASRRPAPSGPNGTGGHALHRQSGDALASPAAGDGGQRKLTFGLGDVGASHTRPQRQPGDFFTRMFGCFSPQVAEVV